MFIPFKADFHSVEFSDWTGNPFFMFEKVAVNFIRMLRVTKINAHFHHFHSEEFFRAD